MRKNWLVTGSARGLGRSIVTAALEAGDRVIATARDPAGLADLEAQHRAHLRTFALDVTDSEAAQAAVDFALDKFDTLDVLVNNAGFAHVAPFEQLPATDFRAQIDANFYGVVNLTRATLPVMRRARAGHIINIASVGARVSSAGLSAYQAAKWAVAGFTEVLAKEVIGFNVKAISVEPGGMRTDWAATASAAAGPLLDEYQSTVGKRLAMQDAHGGNEIGDPDKVAKVIVDLTRLDRLPAHLVLGSDALRVLAEAEAQRQKEAREWEPVSRSTDF